MFVAICLDDKNEPYYINLKLHLDELLKDLLDKSYELVLGGFSKKRQKELLSVSEN